MSQSTRSGSPAISPLLQIGNTQSHDTFNHAQNSFNVTNTHYYLPYPGGYPFLASVAEDPSTTTKSPCSGGINQVDGSQDNRMPVALNSPHASASLDGITVEDRNVHQDYEQSISLTSGASSCQPSVSRATHQSAKTHQSVKTYQRVKTHQRVKTRSILSTVKNLSIRLRSKSLWPKNQLPNLEEPQLWTEFDRDEVDNYMPEGMDKKLKNFMRSHHLGLRNAIPVWNPSPIRGANVRRRLRLDVGDVGTFTRRGGFRVAFNILMNEEINKLCAYDVPQNFSPFKPSLSPEQEKSCFIKDDGVTIDLDNCGAIFWESTRCSEGALSYGFTKTPCESSEPFTSRYDISPMSKNNKRGYIRLPPAYMIYSLDPKDIMTYLCSTDTDLDWLQYLDRLWHREKAPPIIITSVWAARSFACATYNIHPPNISAVAQILTSAKGDRMCWTQVSEGFETACAPLDDGYDGDDKLKSQVADQCFGIEGYVLKSRKELSKMFALLVKT